MSDEYIQHASESSDARSAPNGAQGAKRGDSDAQSPVESRSNELAREYGGRKGPDPVRYGDWEKNGRCIDF